MANMYRSVLAGGGAAVGDATAADVLTGKTFSGAVGSGVAGTMPNNGAVSATISDGGSYTIPAGYHIGSGVVTAISTRPQYTFATGDANFYSGSFSSGANAVTLSTGNFIYDADVSLYDTITISRQGSWSSGTVNLVHNDNTITNAWQS